MYDQANRLRNLVLRAQGATHAFGPPPHVVAVSGGKGGVGTTTLAINIAVALGQLGKRVVLVDADLQRGDVAAFCGLKDDYSVADVMSARRTVHEVLQRGPAGIQIVPGVWAPNKPIELNPMAQRRLLQQLKSLGRHADIVMLDVGTGAGDMHRRYWQAADRVLLITTPDSVSIMDAYATIKVFDSDVTDAEIDVVVNRADGEQQAACVQQRIDASCRRFLARRVNDGGYVPEDPLVTAAAQTSMPVVIATPHSAAVRGIERVAAGIAAGTGPEKGTTGRDPEKAA
jgi:flagellar biosynthesis protein FlhG